MRKMESQGRLVIRTKTDPNRMAVVMAVRPVLPPSDTPEALSTKVVVVEVPRAAPAVVATASASSAPLIRGSFPFFIQHACFGRYTDQCADGIEQIHEQERKQDCQEVQSKDSVEI